MQESHGESTESDLQDGEEPTRHSAQTDKQVAQTNLVTEKSLHSNETDSEYCAKA